MPLRDHFHPPLSVRRHWHAFHSGWATFIASDLNRKLPAGYFAEPNVQFGIVTVPLTLVTDIVEVAVYDPKAEPTLAAVVELVSPANKDRCEQSESFVAKCVAYLRQGIGLVVVDVVTTRQTSLLGELLSQFNAALPHGDVAYLAAAAYRPVERNQRSLLEIWHEGLTLGSPLPTLPLWLLGDHCVPVDLDSTYEQTCLEQRIVDSVE